MNYSEYRTLTLNGKRLEGEELLRFCAESAETHMKEIGAFLQEWLNGADTIKVHTSGSTGTPKEILVKKNQMLSSAAMTVAYFGFERGQNALLALPVSYIAGKMMVVRALFSGLNLVCQKPNSHPISLLTEEEVIHFAPLTPMQMQNIEDTKGIQKILLGGSGLSLRMEDRLQLLSAEIFMGYGMTETLSHIALRRVNGPRKSRVYRALKGVKIGVDDRGCLRAEVPFLEEVVQTNDVIDLQDESGFVWKGRADHVINSGGIKLFPEEIERKLAAIIPQRHFVSAVSDDMLGEKLCLFIEGETYSGEDYARLVEEIESLVTEYENPREIYFIEKFVSTASGKIQRKSTVQKALSQP